MPAQACQMQPHSQQAAQQGWQSTSSAASPPSLSGQLCSSQAAPGSSTETQPLLGQENPWQERCGKQSRRWASLESQLALEGLALWPHAA